MADRRMFSKKVIDDDAFLDMPTSAQLLYFHLAMRADDDGFIKSPRAIMRYVGCKDDDLKVLIMKSFIIPFESGVVVIRHWKIHNYIAKDRYTKTDCPEVESLSLENDVYSLYTPCIQNVDKPYTQDRLGKDSIGKVRIDNAICSEPQGCSEPQEAEAYIYSMILNDKTLYGVTQKEVDHYKELYPAVDVDQEMRSMVGWCENNPTRRKTRSGIKRFINSWLAKEQNKGGNHATGTNRASTYRGNTIGDPIPVGSGEIVV